jgi:hypothetical protein
MSGDTENVRSIGLRPAAVDRDNPRNGAAPFYNLVKAGRVQQITPNGCSYDGPYEEFSVKGDTIVGAQGGLMPEPYSWPKGNRSGE